MGIFSSLGRNIPEVLTAMNEARSGIRKITRWSTAGLLTDCAGEIPAGWLSRDPRPTRSLAFALIAAVEALQDSGLDVQPGDHRVGLSFATCNGDLTGFEVPRKLVDVDPDAARNLPQFQQADAVAEHLGLRGPVLTSAAACAASGGAIAMGRQLVAERYVPAVLVGGADSLAESVCAGFNILRALSPQPCAPFGRPFGLSLGEGAAFVVLESLHSAKARGAPIYAEITGYGLHQDAHHVTAPHPDGEGVERAVSAALHHGGMAAEEIEYINLHGTGTESNDRAELAGVRRALGRDHFPRVFASSSKSYFGHTLGAAAVMEYVATLAAVGDGKVPATLHTTEVREGCEDARLVLGHPAAAEPKAFLNVNAAFGGHNSAIASRVWRDGAAADMPLTAAASPSRVVIAGSGMANAFGCLPGNTPWLSADTAPAPMADYRRHIREYMAPYYVRRMNELTQFSIAAADLALDDAGMDRTPAKLADTGLVFGTTYGSYGSLAKYLQPFFEKGAAAVSSLYFPDTVLNSTPGKVAAQLGGIKGYGTTLSTGGNEGLAAAFAGYELIRSGFQRYCLVGAGDEISDLAGQVNRVLELDASAYPLSEGSAFLLLTSLETAQAEGMHPYAELTGFGLSRDFQTAARQALARADVPAKALDFVLFNDIGFAERTKEEVGALRSLCGDTVPMWSVNGIFGYGFAVSSLYHVCVGAALLRDKPAYTRGLVISSAYHGGSVAAVMEGLHGRDREGPGAGHAGKAGAGLGGACNSG